MKEKGLEETLVLEVAVSEKSTEKMPAKFESNKGESKERYSWTICAPMWDQNQLEKALWMSLQNPYSAT